MQLSTTAFKLSLKRRLRQAGPSDLKTAYVDFVRALMTRMPAEEAVKFAIGGGFEEIGAIEAALVSHYGLSDNGYLIDVGCGSGRLAIPLAARHGGRYLGVDLVPELIAHARKATARPDWRFQVIDHIEIPERDGAADMVCFFSVLTHLLHEQSYWYLEEARRVLKPGGVIVASFLEFAEPGHHYIFEATLAAAKARTPAPMNVFIERNALETWASKLGLELVEFQDAAAPVVPEGALGQSLCILRKPS